MKLFAVYLGGRMSGCNIEMHDVQLVIGNNIEETYQQLKKSGLSKGTSFHIDAYMEIKYVDGYEIEIIENVDNIDNSSNQSLYFVNIGGYDKNLFGEMHEIGFFVSTSSEEAKIKAKTILGNNYEIKHKDDLFQVDDILKVDNINDYNIKLTPTYLSQSFVPEWFGFRII